MIGKKDVFHASLIIKMHHNITKKFKSPRELHMYMEPILNKVIRDLPLDLEENLRK